MHSLELLFCIVQLSAATQKASFSLVRQIYTETVILLPDLTFHHLVLISTTDRDDVMISQNRCQLQVILSTDVRLHCSVYSMWYCLQLLKPSFDSECPIWSGKESILHKTPYPYGSERLGSSGRCYWLLRIIQWIQTENWSEPKQWAKKNPKPLNGHSYQKCSNGYKMQLQNKK